VELGASDIPFVAINIYLVLVPFSGFVPSLALLALWLA
jgi:hypothetical protein